jgi:histidine triad (HIT) family protein
MEDSIFTKIIRGEIPSHKVYEDEKTFAFLDIHPAAEGHVLVIPKKQVEFIWDLEDEDYQALMKSVKQVGRRLREVMGKKYVGTIVVGTDVPHAHVHVVPFETAENIKAVVSMVGRDQIEPDHAALAALAERLSF